MEKDKGQYVYDYLIGKGLTPAAASGVVGNLVAESGLNTTIKGTADNKGSIGIAQWHSERKEGLLNFAKSQGKNYTDLNTQLDYLVYELKQPEYKDALTGLQSAKTPKEAANIFMNKFEKPAEWAKKQSSGKRIGVANAVFNGMPYEGIDYSQDDSPIGYTDYTLGLAPLPGQLAGYRRDVTEEVSNDPFSKLAEKQQEEDFTNEVRQQQQSQQERPQVQPNPLYSAENYQLQQFQPTQYQGQIFSEGFFQEGGTTDSTGNNPKRFDELIIDYSNEDTRKKLNSKFMNIHTNSNTGCTAGSLNCLTDYVQPVLNSPSVRSMTQQNTSKYRIPSKDYLDFGNNYVPNTSIDAWEIHQQLSGENLGTNLINPKSKLTYKKNKKGVDMHQIPNELDYKKLPIGTILGQGNSAYDYTDPKLGTKSRHAMTIVGYDKKDGEPLVYDYGKIRRLSDDIGIIGAAPINNVTIPKGYEKYTYDYLKNQSKNYTTKLGYDKKTAVNFNSKKPHILAIQEGANEVKTSIGKNYGIPRDAMDKLAYFLPGISNKETGINNNETTTASKVLDNVTGNFLLKPLVKAGQNILTFGENLTKEDAPKKKLYQLEIEAYKKFPKDAVKRKNYERKLREQNDNLQNTDYKSLDSSVGPFAIKNLPQYATNKLNINKGDMYGIMNSNLGELKTGAKAALNVLAENYAKIQKKNPKLSKEELIDLTISSYNNGSKQNDPDYIRYYIKKDSKKLKDNYLEKIKGFNSFEDGGKKEIEPKISPEARSMGDAGIRFGNKFSTSLGANLRDKNIRAGASYNKGNFSTDINYTRGLDNTSNFSGNASYNPGKYNINLSYEKGPEGYNNLSAGAGYNGDNLSGNIGYNQNNQDRSLSGDVRYGRGNFSGSLGTNFTLGQNFNPNVRGDIGYQNRNLRTSIGAGYNKETGFEPNLRATYTFQEGGKVKYGTPEYEKAYNKGEVVTEDGQRSPIALDEVVIQNNYKRPRGFWEQYRDKIVDENKDAGLMGAIVGTPISAITSLPQMAATYAFTDKVQRPSEAMNIRNPYGAIAVDAVLDPANALGAGILTKENALSKLGKIRTSISPNLRKGLRTNGPSFGSKIKHTFPEGYNLTPDESGNRYWLNNNNKQVGQVEYMSPTLDTQGRNWGSINIEIDPRHRGKGLSAPMYQKMLDHAEQQGHYGIMSIDGSLQSPTQSKAIRKYFNGKYSEDSNLLKKTNETIDADNAYTKEDNLLWGEDEPMRPYESNVYLMSSKNKFQDGGLKAKADRAYAQEIYDQIRPSDYTSLNNYARYIFSVKRDDYDDARSEEAFKQYLGLNDKPKYLSPSKYAPSIKAKGKEGEYYRVDPELENDIFHSYKDKVKLNEVVPVDEINIKSEWPIGTPLTQDGYVKLDPYDDNIIVGRPMASRARMLGRFTVSRGKDKKGEYLSYSDQYDFPDTFQNKMKGKPYNVYNRIYYKDMKQMGGTISDNEKAFLQEYSNGGTIPVSSNGVYDYPGQEVIVPTNSGRITMKNVPYDMLGIDEYGNQQMMQSNGEYQFPGKIIHEIPQTKKKISIKSKLK